MGLPPEEYKFICEEYGPTPEEHESTTEEFHCFSTGAGGGGEVADIKCNTPFGTFLYPQDHCLPRGRFWVVKQRPYWLFVVGRNVA